VHRCVVQGVENLFIPGITLHRPRTKDQVIELMEKYEGSCRLMAGGTDLLVDLKSNLRLADHIIVLSQVPDLRFIREDDDGLEIGALSSLNDLIGSDLVRQHLPALSETASTMASNQVRNLGTLGGNISSAVPSADAPPVLISAGAVAHFHSADGERSVPLGEHFTGVRCTTCGGREFLTRITIPKQPANSGSAYEKFQLRDANALAVASVAAWVRLDGGKVAESRIILGAVAPVPVHAEKAAKSLLGKSPNQETLEEAGRVARDECSPIDDVRGSAEYRRHLVEVLTPRALHRAAQRAGGMA